MPGTGFQVPVTHSSRRSYRGVVTHDSLDSKPVVERAPEVVEHRTSVVDQGAFTVAECSCGWRSYARRSRPLARREAHDHEVLHAPAAS